MRLNDAVRLVRQARAEHLAPPDPLTVSEWADQYRVLSAESSAEPGRWRTSRAEYTREIMDSFTDPTIETVVVQSSAQVGKTEIVNNCLGYVIDREPGPCLLLQPTSRMGEKWSRTRFAPMCRDTEPLQFLVSRQVERTNTVSRKDFPGGYLIITGANSAAELASQPIRYLLLDEVDRFPHSVGDEGDPVQLAVKRTTTYWNRRVVMVSTPTVKDISRIAAAFEDSDQRYFLVPCHSCGHEQRLVWSGVRWDEGRPETARYHCSECDAAWTDAQRWKAIRQGRWTTTKPHTGTAGFHLNEIYSSWVKLTDMAANFLYAKANGKLQEFTNLSLGEVWEEAGNVVDQDSLVARCEDYESDSLPVEVLCLTAGVDVQQDRLEVEVCGWGHGDESWNVSYLVIWGDPSTPDVWTDLDTALAERYRRADGAELTVKATAVDSGAFTTDVYRYANARRARRVFAVKGMAGQGRPILRKMKTKAAFLVGVDTAKEKIYSHLKLQDHGPGYCHFPMDRDTEYFEQLTAEKQLTKFNKGFPYKVWQKVRTRNEALDCRVYAMASREFLNPNYAALEKSLKPSKEQREVNTERQSNSAAPGRRRQRRKRGYSVM